jgi:glycerol dehydrogenase-like iron-containing ADH family enzyme
MTCCRFSALAVTLNKEDINAIETRILQILEPPILCLLDLSVILLAPSS